MAFIGRKPVSAVATLDLEEVGIGPDEREQIESLLGVEPGQPLKKSDLDALERDPNLSAAQRQTIAALLDTLRGNLVGSGQLTVSKDGATATRQANLLTISAAKWVQGEGEVETRMRESLAGALIGQQAQLDAFVKLAKDFVSPARLTPPVMAMTGHVGHGKDQAIAAAAQVLFATAPSATATRTPSSPLYAVDLSGLGDSSADALFGDEGALSPVTLKKKFPKGVLIRIDGAGADASGASLQTRAPKIARGLQALLLARKGEPSHFNAAWIFNFDEPQPRAGARRSALEQMGSALGQAGVRVLSAQAPFDDLDAAAMRAYAELRLPALFSQGTLVDLKVSFDDEAWDLLGRALATPHAPLDELDHRLLRCVLTHLDTQTSLGRDGNGVRIALARGMRDEGTQKAWLAEMHAALPDLEQAERAFVAREVAKPSSDIAKRSELMALLRDVLEAFTASWVDLATEDDSHATIADLAGIVVRLARNVLKEAERRAALGELALISEQRQSALTMALSMVRDEAATLIAATPSDPAAVAVQTHLESLSSVIGLLAGAPP
jgi:hypothetical protein